MFNINGEEWAVHLVSPNHPALIRNDGTFAIGSCDDDTKTIYVNDMLNEYLMQKKEIEKKDLFFYYQAGKRLNS